MKLTLLNQKVIKYITGLLIFSILLIFCLFNPFIPPIQSAVQTNGLNAQYFNSKNLSGTPVTKIDSTIDFNWGMNKPDPSINADMFSIRWTGQIMPNYSETYTFYTTTDDGVKLWVNNQLLINKWKLQPATTWQGSINLSAGTKYDIKMEFYENRYDAVAKLSWSSPSTPKQIVTQSNLFPTVSASTPTPTSTPSPTPPPTPSPTPSPTQSPVVTQTAYLTFYGWPDNSPPGNEIAYPIFYNYPTLHTGAGGTGTFDDPITFASDPQKFAIGSKLYIPFLQKYVIMEDYCGGCINTSPNHVDVWMNSNSDFSDQLISCQQTWTRPSIQIELNPPSDRAVNTTPLFNTSTGVCLTP